MLSDEYGLSDSDENLGDDDDFGDMVTKEGLLARAGGVCGSPGGAGGAGGLSGAGGGPGANVGGERRKRASEMSESMSFAVEHEPPQATLQSTATGAGGGGPARSQYEFDQPTKVGRAFMRLLAAQDAEVRSETDIGGGSGGGGGKARTLRIYQNERWLPIWGWGGEGHLLWSDRG